MGGELVFSGEMPSNPHDFAYSERLVEPTESRSVGKVLALVFPFLWPRDQFGMRVRVVIAVATLILGRSANVYGPIVLKELVDGLGALATNAITVQALLGFAFLYGAMVLVPGVLTEIRAAVFTPVSEYAQRVLGLKTFRHLHDLSIRFHLDRRTGGLARAVERGTRALEQLTRLFAFNIGPTLFEISAVALYLGFGYPFKYVLVILIAVVAYVLFTLLFTEWRTRFRREMIEAESRATTIGVDSLLNFETVKYFNNERFEADRYNGSLLQYMVAAVKSQTTLGFLNGGQLIVRVACQIAILVMAVLDFAAGTLTVGEVVMLNTFMLQLFIPLGFLGSSYRMIRQALVDMEFLFKLLELEPEIKDRPNAAELEVSNAAVQFDDIRFGYDERIVLDGVSFSIKPGTTTAVVGPSGAGKSTLARLLYRFYEPQRGSVEIDGTDVGSVTQESLRKNIGIVPQDTVLFNDTIRYNIRYGRPDASDEEVEEAARVAHILDFIRLLPAGFETRVGERGLKLSGGEKQRVAIARTVLKDPPIFVLDEATSSLDTGTEREIQRALKEVATDRTTLVIAHRLATIVDADEIIVLDNGQIVERGNHDTLLERDGRYAELWRKQQRDAALAEEALAQTAS